MLCLSICSDFCKKVFYLGSRSVCVCVRTCTSVSVSVYHDCPPEKFLQLGSCPLGRQRRLLRPQPEPEHQTAPVSLRGQPCSLGPARALPQASSLSPTTTSQVASSCFYRGGAVSGGKVRSDPPRAAAGKWGAGIQTQVSALQSRGPTAPHSCPASASVWPCPPPQVRLCREHWGAIQSLFPELSRWAIGTCR